MKKYKSFIALFIIFLIITFPVNASISFNGHNIYSTENLKKEKIIPFKLENFEVPTQLNENINLHYQIDVLAENFILRSINLNNSLLKLDNNSKIRLNMNLSMENEIPIHNVSLNVFESPDITGPEVLTSTEIDYETSGHILNQDSSGVPPLDVKRRNPRPKSQEFGLMDVFEPLDDCNENGGWCSCYYGCSTPECCSGTCEYYTCLDYGCYWDFPNLCNSGCWSACSSGYIFNCASDGGHCCPETHPYYCQIDNLCWYTEYLPNPCASGCPPEYPDECNGGCYACSSGELCCPSSGPPSSCCGSSQICQSDGSCLTVECYNNEDCSDDFYYCSGDSIMFRNFYCSNYQCKYLDSEYTDCNDYNQWFCLDSNSRAYADYTCGSSGCEYTETSQQSCAWGCSGGYCITGTTVHGYMKYSSGSGVPNVKFKLEDCSTGSTIAYDYTDSSGYYSINAAAGNYILSADYLGYDIDFTGCTSFAGDMSVSDISLSASLSGYVKYSGGSGRVGVIVRLKDCSNNVVDSDVTDSGGYYYLSDSDAGYYKVTMELYGSEFEVFPCQAIFSGMNAPDLVFNARLSGYIEDSGGNGKADIPVKLTDCSGVTVDTATTDSAGYFMVESADAGYFDFYINYLGYDIKVLDCQAIVGNAQFSDPIVLEFTMYGYLKDLDNNPLEDYAIELYDCSENFVAGTQTLSTGYFTISDTADEYMIMIDIGGGWKLKLVDQNDDDCFFLLGDIDIGTLNINPTPDCSVFDYLCYEENIKLFGCSWNEVERGCYCYGTECLYGCTDGLEECDPGDYGTIYADVDDINNYPIYGARIYVDDDYRGSTDTQGKYSFSVLFGYRDIEVNCPDFSYCGSRQVYVNGNEYVYFDCNCPNLDSDSDDYSDEEERIIGTDPYDASSNLKAAYINPDFSTSCWDFAPLFSGFFSEEEIMSIVNQLNSSESSYNLLFDENLSHGDIYSKIGIDKRKLANDKRKTLAMLEDSSSVSYISKGNSVILLLTDDETGVTSIFPIASACCGQIIGILAGAGYGLKDDFVGVFSLGKMVLTGLWHIITREKKLRSIWGDVINLLKAVGGLWEQREELIHDLVMNIFGKGKWILDKVGAQTGTDEYVSFQLGFFGGYITGYIVEQIVLFEVIIAKAASTFKVIAKGMKISDKITDAARILQRIASEFGGRVGDILRKTKVWLLVKTWGDDIAESGMARLAKYLDDTKLVDDFVKQVDDVKSLATKIDDVARIYGDDVAETLIKSKYGVEALKAGWNADELNGLFILIDTFGDDFVVRLNVHFTDDVYRILNKGMGREVIEIRKVNPTQLGEYIKYWSGDPIESAAETHQLLRMYKAKGVRTAVGDSGYFVNDVAILKKGTSEWGWEHITTRNHHIQIKDALNLDNTDIAVKKVIGEVLESGNIIEHVPGEKYVISKVVTRGSKSKAIKVVVSESSENSGSMITAFPWGE